MYCTLNICFISGPSQAGKTYLTKQIVVEHARLINRPLKKIFYCTPPSPARLSEEEEKLRHDLRAVFSSVEFVEGLPPWSEIALHAGDGGGAEQHGGADDRENDGGTLCILDDLATEVLQDPDMVTAFTTKSHHYNISIIFITQHYHMKGRFSTTIVQNCNYKILLNDRANKLFLSTISRQAFPGQNNFLGRAMTWCEKNIKSTFNHYLLIDSSSLSQLPSKARVRTNIFKMRDIDDYITIMFDPLEG